MRAILACVLVSALAGAPGADGKPAPAPVSRDVPRTGKAASLPGLPGCTPALADALRKRIGEMAAPRSPAELAEIWRSPCLAHFARFFSVPEGLEPDELRELWEDGLWGALRWSVGGFDLRDGKRVFVLPPDPRSELAEHDRRALGRWVCGEGEPGCDRSLSYRMRAEESFDRSSERNRRRFHLDREDASVECADSGPDPGATAFESWAACVVADAPQAQRYARVRLRAPARGWLVLRGRRGHYTFADELRAYDLATGAAYVARSQGGLALERGGTVDFAATDAGRVAEAFTGSVAADQLRELAFVLATGRAVHPVRTSQTVQVPRKIEIALGRSEWPPIRIGGDGIWVTSAQTWIAFALVDGDDLLAKGGFTWPDSANAVDDHADGLIRVLEAGLVRGCAPAHLPEKLLVLAQGRGGVSRLDADPRRQDAVQAALDRAFEGLRAGACPGAP